MTGEPRERPRPSRDTVPVRQRERENPCAVPAASKSGTRTRYREPAPTPRTGARHLGDTTHANHPTATKEQEMTSPQQAATALESLHVPVNVAAATTGRTPTGTLRTRVVGATAIASAALVVIDNTVVGSAGSPTYGATVKEVLAFHADHPVAVTIAVGLEALNV